MTTKDQESERSYNLQVIPRYGKFLFIVRDESNIVIGSVELENEKEVERWKEALSNLTKEL